MIDLLKALYTKFSAFGTNLLNKVSEIPDVSGLTEDVAGLKEDMTAAQGDITSIDGRVDTLEDHVGHVDEVAAISDLLNIPVNSFGRVYLDTAASPTGAGFFTNYFCCGKDTSRFLVITKADISTVYINWYSSNAWSGWLTLDTTVLT